MSIVDAGVGRTVREGCRERQGGRHRPIRVGRPLDALAGVAAEAGDIATAQGLCQPADGRMEAASDFIT